MLLSTPAFFRMSLQVTKPGFTPKTWKPKLNLVNGKVRGHLNWRRQGKWEATSSQCWFDSLIKRELFTKNLFLLVKQLMLHSTSKFWNVYRRMCEGSDLISGRTTHGCSTMTIRQPMLPSWLDGFWLITTWLVPHPPYSPNLAPSAFFLFLKLEMKLKGRRFQTEEIQAESQAILNTLRENDFQECFINWQHCWNLCQASEGDNFEGDAGP